MKKTVKSTAGAAASGGLDPPSSAAINGAAMMESICFQRSDIPPEFQARGVWMLKVIRFMRLRGWLSNRWMQITTGALEGRVTLPEPLPDMQVKNLKLSNGMKDSYHAAATCKKTFDAFMHSLLRLVKPKVSREFHSWEEWKAALDLAAESKRTAVTEAVAELDALHAAVVFQPLKEKARTEQKARENYHGHIRAVKDIVRGSIVCESDKDICSVLAKIREITRTYTPIDLEEFQRKKTAERGRAAAGPSRLSLAPRGIGTGIGIGTGTRNKGTSRGGASASSGRGSNSARGEAENEEDGSGDGGGGGGDGYNLDTDRLDTSRSGGSEQSSVSKQSTQSVATAGQYEEARKQRERDICTGMRVVSCSNRFKLPAAHGYRDVIIVFAVDYIHEQEQAPGHSAAAGDEPHYEIAQCLCELQLHHADMLDFADSMRSWDFYSYFRTFFGKSAASATQDRTAETAAVPGASGGGVDPSSGKSSAAAAESQLANDTPLAFQNKLKALKTMDQVGEFVEQLEAAMEVYLGGVGRVGKDLPRLSAYFQLFARVGEVELAEAMQASLIRQLRDRGRVQDLYGELSKLSQYFKTLQRYAHAKPLSEEALALCEQLRGPGHIETAVQLTNHANLLHCCDQLADALPLFDRALALKRSLLGDLNPITYHALDHLASVHYDRGDYPLALRLYNEVLEVHREIARKSRTGQAGPEVAHALTNIARIYEVDPVLLDFDRCYKLYGEISIIYEDFYGPEHLTRADVLEATANLKDQEGLLAEALALHRAALDLRRRLFAAASEYMGVSETDSHNNPPWACLADSCNAVGELLLELGEVPAATVHLREALRMRIVLNDPCNHHLSHGAENASMALAAVQTNLAMAIVQGERRKHHHQGYFEARDIAKPAYSVRMKYLGVRAVQTEQTINVVGLVDELIKDYAAEKEKILQERRYQKEREEKSAAKLAAKLSAYTTAVAETANKSANANASANASAISKKAAAPAPLRIGQKVTAESLAVKEAEVVVQEVREEQDPLRGHVHSRGVNDIGARQQLDVPVAKAHEKLEMAERLRDLGELNSALKCSLEALAHLRPDLYSVPDSASLAGSAAESQDGGLITPLAGLALAPKTEHRSVRGPERKLAFAVALSYLGTAQTDKGWHNHAVLSFQQSLDLIIQTYGDAYIHKDIAQGLSSLAMALRCAGHSESAIEVGLQARSQWVALIRKDVETEARIKKEEEEEEEEEEATAAAAAALGANRLLKGADGSVPVALRTAAPDDNSVASLRRAAPTTTASARGSGTGAGTAAALSSPVARGGGSALQNSVAENENEDDEKAEKEEKEKGALPLNDPDWYNPKHHDASHVAKMDHMMALSLVSLNRFQEADARCLQCLSSLRAAHDTDLHPDIIAVLNTHGLVKAHLGDLEGAFTSYFDILKLRGRVFGTSDPAYAMGINNYAAAMFLVDDMAYAGRTWTESLELRERQVAVGSASMVTALHNMAALFWRQENPTEAAPFEQGKDVIKAFLLSQFGEPVLEAQPQPTSN